MDTLNALFLATDRITRFRRQAERERLAAPARQWGAVPTRPPGRIARRPAVAEPCR